MNFFLVSGLSGSGKSIALQALEDMGYYCIDNLPASLLSRFAGDALNQSENGSKDCAVSIDSRNRQFLRSLPANLKELEQLGLHYKMLFLEADEEILVKRFSETRRKHPLTDHRTALIEGIQKEKELLEPLAMAATRRIDTSDTTRQELRGLVRDFAGREIGESLMLLFESFGYKHSVPRDADFVFDVRCLPNPYWQESLQPLTGLDDQVQEFLLKSERVDQMIKQIREFITYWLPAFQQENRSYITVAIGCTGGRHRSVFIADKLAEHFKNKPFHVQVRHREFPNTFEI
ncbi:MAG: RNase adapter protein RapZ [Gammaproteobacteria bacterium]|nr:RNase adapter protein RapZ [Gammaproteobacteria bacterium]